jgi:hypothetical protein
MELVSSLSTHTVVGQVRRQRHLPDDARPAALESPDVRNAALGVERCGRERQHLVNASAGLAQRQPDLPRLPRRAARGVNQGPRFAGVEIFPTTE